MGIVFANAANVPLFVVLQVVVIVLIWGSMQVYLRITNPSQALPTETPSAETTSLR